VLGYEVMVNGKSLCKTLTNSCPIAGLIGPASKVTITALGNDGTMSSTVSVPYVATAPIPALNVNFALGSSALSVAQKAEIKKIALIIKGQGFTRLVVNGFTDLSGSPALNKALSRARAISVANFMKPLLPLISITANALGSGKPISTNASKSGQQLNRRTEISTW
jgi:outer membrane protein OmpA-like peptidoglycan-associated protein